MDHLRMHGTKARLLIGQALYAPSAAWVLSGFFVAFLLFFVYPIFWSAGAMQFPIYVPAAHPIGADLKIFLRYITVWLAKGSQGVGPSPYPPVTRLLFAPLILVRPNTAYAVITLVSVFCFVLLTLLIPLKTSRDRHVGAVPMFFFVTGLLSYGFQFELERGQFNVIAACSCFVGIWIFHHKPGLRCIAYLLFTVSVQLKVYPFLFVIMLIRDWKDWKHNIRRILALGAANTALLLALGPAALGDSLRGMTSQMTDPYVWIGNHSVHSFATLAAIYASAHGWAWLEGSARLLELAMMALVFACLFLIMVQAYRKNQHGLNSGLLLACTLAAMLLPAASQDYKLSILAAPCAVVFCLPPFSPSSAAKTRRPRFILPALMFVFAAAYSSTLFSFTNKPSLLQNNFPALLAMLLSVTCLILMFDSQVAPSAPANEEMHASPAALDVGAARN